MKKIEVGEGEMKRYVCERDREKDRERQEKMIDTIMKAQGMNRLWNQGEMVILPFQYTVFPLSPMELQNNEDTDVSIFIFHFLNISYGFTHIASFNPCKPIRQPLYYPHLVDEMMKTKRP